MLPQAADDSRQARTRTQLSFGRNDRWAPHCNEGVGATAAKHTELKLRARIGYHSGRQFTPQRGGSETAAGHPTTLLQQEPGAHARARGYGGANKEQSQKVLTRSWK
jgi:hypothetical protein